MSVTRAVLFRVCVSCEIFARISDAVLTVLDMAWQVLAAGRSYEDCCLLGCDSVLSGGSVPEILYMYHLSSRADRAKRT
jgi:hypothetical protein